MNEVKDKGNEVPQNKPFMIKPTARIELDYEDIVDLNSINRILSPLTAALIGLDRFIGRMNTVLVNTDQVTYPEEQKIIKPEASGKLVGLDGQVLESENLPETTQNNQEQVIDNGVKIES